MNLFDVSSVSTMQPGHSIRKWFLTLFILFSLIFFIMTLPLISYSKKTFSNLETDKIGQQIDTGISQLENVVTSTVSASISLAEDSRFLQLRYRELDFSKFTVSIRRQMVDYLHGLMFPLDLVSDCALQLTDRLAITPTMAQIDSELSWYPARFRVNDLSFADWEKFLAENVSQFMPACRVTTLTDSYDALIYTTHWSNGAYFYVCLDIADIKQALIAKDDLDTHYFTIERIDGTLLYSDLSDDLLNYYHVTKESSIGGLTITVHIPKTVIRSRIAPLYSFLLLYFALCTLVVILVSIVGSHVSSRPLFKIIDLIDSDKTNRFDPSGNLRTPLMNYGFKYISDNLQSYKSNLMRYRETIDAQTKILQARFLEKALQGSLITNKDFASFDTYFPSFPDNFCLVQFELCEQAIEGENIYPDYVSLISGYIDYFLPNAYIQQLDDSKLLLIIDKRNFDEYSPILTSLIDNINCNEPCYRAWGIVSNFYDSPKLIASAYGQIQDFYSETSTDELSRLYVLTDRQITRKRSFQLSDVSSIHFAIVSGNKKHALTYLESYFDSLNANNRTIYEMFRAILLCIKQEYADLLFEYEIPVFHTHLNLYSSLEDAVCTYCDKLKPVVNQTPANSFAQEIKVYIDNHFTDENLCLATLTEHFDCSVTTIRRAFSQITDTSVSAYIESKRMEMANELLQEGKYKVSEIAQKCGYTNHNTFYKAYQRKFGFPPSSNKQ